MRLESGTEKSVPDGIVKILYTHKFSSGRFQGENLRSLTYEIFLDLLMENGWIDEENSLLFPFNVCHATQTDRKGNKYHMWGSILSSPYAERDFHGE